MNNITRLLLCAALSTSVALTAKSYRKDRLGEETNNTRPDAALSSCCTPAHNIPARVNTQGVDFFLEGSLIYWHVSQEYMDVGRTAAFVANAESTPVPLAEVAVHNFDYHPGFQVGFGFGTDFDDWVVKVNYTRIHDTTSSTVGSIPGALSTGSLIYIPNEWFVNLSINLQQEMAQISSTWKYDFDMIDFTLGRPFYQGRRLILSPFAGLRTLWLDQRFDVSAVNANSLGASPATSYNKSDSWSLGVVTGTVMNWYLGEGFTIDFDFDMSLLYMKYKNLLHTENVQNTVTGQANLDGFYPDNGALRPTLKTGLGFSWGSYLAGKDYHLDFGLKYDFMILPYQNMMRGTLGYLANNNFGYSNPLGSLFMHGLDFSARFDF